MSDVCKCGFYNRHRVHSGINGGLCEHYRTADLEAQLSQLQAENARLKEEAKKQIRRACSNAVEKLNEFAPGMGWDSGDTVAEGYIKALAAEKGEKS